MYKTSDFRGPIRDPIRIEATSGNELYQAMRKNLPATLKDRGIPHSVHEDTVKSGGMLGTKLPMLIISHPNPPTSFFNMGFIVNDHVISFVYLGESAQNTKMNKKLSMEAEGKHLRAAMIKPDEFILQQEKLWNSQVLDSFDSLLRR